MLFTLSSLAFFNLVGYTSHRKYEIYSEARSEARRLDFKKSAAKKRQTGRWKCAAMPSVIFLPSGSHAMKAII